MALMQQEESAVLQEMSWEEFEGRIEDYKREHPEIENLLTRWEEIERVYLGALRAMEGTTVTWGKATT